MTINIFILKYVFRTLKFSCSNTNTRAERAAEDFELTFRNTCMVRENRKRNGFVESGFTVKYLTTKTISIFNCTTVIFDNGLGAR